MELLNFFLDFLSYWLYALVLLLTTLWYKIHTLDFNYWQKQGVPFVKPKVVIGTLKPTWIYAQHDQDMEAFKKYGRVYGGFEGGRPVLFVSDPEMIKQILIKDFHAFPTRRHIPIMERDKLLANTLPMLRGEEWKTVRSALTPSYTSGKLKQLIPLMEDCVQSLIISLSIQADIGKPIELTKKFTVLTLDVIASCAFGIKTDCINNPDSEFVIKAQKAFRAHPSLMYFLTIFPNVVNLLPNFVPIPFHYFTEVAKKTIDLRLGNQQNNRADLLQMMLEAEEQELPPGSKKIFTRDIMVSQTVLFLMAGHETTANALTLMSYELSINKHVQEKLIKEIDEVMLECKGKLTYEAVQNMQYLDMVVSETLRKYPSGARNERRCAQNGYTINDIVLREDMTVLIPVYVLHHNSDFYPDPEKFDPERFSTESKALRDPFTFLPFGMGPRSCVAMRFALLEAKLVIAHLLYNFQLEACSDTTVPVKFAKSGLGLLQPESVKLQLVKRAHQS